MQRFAPIFLVGLCLMACAMANDLDEGSRELGDAIVTARRLLRPAIPGKSMTAKSGFNANGRITAITAKNAAGSDASVIVLKGGVGTKHVVVSAISAPGAGIDVELKVYAIEDAAADASLVAEDY